MSSVSLAASPFSPSRSIPRPSSVNSVRSARANSPALSISPDDPVAIRNHMSTLKHTIRHQQAQLSHLETLLQRAPRLPATSSMYSPPPSPVDSLSSQTYTPNTPTSTKMKRRSSHDILQSLAGPDSNIPLPRRESVTLSSLSDGIREGIPMTFGTGRSTPSYKRTPSPTRTLSRIPVSAVGNARALADEGLTPSRLPQLASIDLTASTSSTISLQPPSPGRTRVSLTPGGTSKVLAELQTVATSTRAAHENTKAQLRLSQRSVSQLTRQTEDLKEVRERLRLENEGLNNVVARKERLLQEVLERARKAEAEAATLKSQFKTESVTTKKSLREMETALAESTALSSKSEREYITLRDSLRDMKASWRTDMDTLREEMRKREERWRKDEEELGTKYRRLLEEVQEQSKSRETIKDLKEKSEKIHTEVEEGFREEIANLRAEIETSSRVHEKAEKTAEHLSGELTRLRRLMQSVGRPLTPDAPP